MEKKPIYAYSVPRAFYNNLFLFVCFGFFKYIIILIQCPLQPESHYYFIFVITFNLDIFHILDLLKQNIASFIWQEPTRKLSFNSLFTLYGKQQGENAFIDHFQANCEANDQPVSTYMQSLYFTRNGNHGLLKRKKVTICIQLYSYIAFLYFLFVL